MSRSPVCAFLFLCLAAFTSARAQTALVIAPDQPLALDQAIAFALQKNFQLQTQTNTLERQKENLEIALAPFDPVLTGSFNRSYNKVAARTSTLEGTANDNTSFSARVSQLVPWTNGIFSVGTTNLTRNASNNTFDVFNPNYGFGLNAQYNQSLQNFGRDAAFSNLNRTKIGVGIAYINYRNQVLNIIRDTETAYYTLVTARETLRIRQASLTMAARIFDENSARRGTGVMTDLDVLTSEVGVATAQRAIIQAEETVRNAEENLLNLINLPQFDTRLGPVKFEDYTDGTPNLAVSYKLAREQYPPTQLATEQLKQVQIDLETAQRALRPNLNLNASAGYSARPSSDSYQDVISNLIPDHGRNWSIGLNYSLPWGRRADKARVRQAQLDIASQKLALESQEQQLSLLVRQAVRSIETNMAAVEVATKASRLSERQYEQQKARYDAGLTTSRQVQQFQDDLENARFSELSAKLVLRRAAAELRRLEGSSLQRYGVKLMQ